MKKRFVFSVLLVLGMLFVVGCGSQQAEADSSDAAEEAPAAAEEQAADELTVGALWLDASEFYTMVEAGIHNAAANADTKINSLGSNSQGDSAIEADQMQTLIGANVDAIIMSAVSEDASVEFIKQA